MAFTTSVTYTGDGATTLFQVPFPFLRAADLVVTVDGGVVPIARPSTSTIEISPAPTNGAEIVIRRDTDIDEPIVDFADESALLAADIDAANLQLLHRLQETANQIEEISVGTGGGNLPVPLGNQRFLVSDNASQWTQKTVSEVQTILGIGNAVPSPVSGNMFLVTNLNSNTYELQTVEQIKTLLGVGSFALPSINGRANNFLATNSSGTNYTLLNQQGVITALGLGNCAFRNGGTNAGQVPILVNGTGGAALPAVSGEFLTNIAKAIDYALWHKTTTVGTSLNSFVTATDGMSQLVDSAGAWDSASAGGVTVTAGKYLVKFEVSGYCQSGSTQGQLQLKTTGTATPSVLSAIKDINTTAGNGTDYISVECMVHVPSGTSELSLEVKSSSFGVFVYILESRLHLMKIE